MQTPMATTPKTPSGTSGGASKVTSGISATLEHRSEIIPSSIGLASTQIGNNLVAFPDIQANVVEMLLRNRDKLKDDAIAHLSDNM
jgi:hypothetical protein